MAEKQKWRSNGFEGVGSLFLPGTVFGFAGNVGGIGNLWGIEAAINRRKQKG
jgi:hypothetical protein